ncbi:MAG: hypothetical protein ACRDHU_13290 [Actinomycetota bacterium]
MDERRDGIYEDGPPRPSPLGIACTIGAVWGLLGYSILWEGIPFLVQRPFVQSVTGTLVLLPIRTVLWAIHASEGLAGRSFDFSRNHWWIAVLAGLVGAATGAAVWWGARSVLRRLRPGSGARFDTRR